MITMVAMKICTPSVSLLINLSGLLLVQIFLFETRTKVKSPFGLQKGEISMQKSMHICPHGIIGTAHS